MPGVDATTAGLSLGTTPADEEAVRLEQTLLGGLLCNPGALEFLPPGFGAQHFAGEDHGDIFTAISLAAADGAKVLLPSVRQKVPEAAAYIASLVGAMVSARAEDCRAYATSVMEAADLRALLALADGIKQEAASSGILRQPLSALIAKASGELERIAVGQRVGMPGKTLLEAMDEAIACGEEAHARGDGLAGISCGFPSLDARLGGMEGGAVYVLGARPGVGKTALATQVAMRVAQNGAPVLFVSLEMKAAQIGRRALALAARVDLGAIKQGEFVRQQWMSDALVAGRNRMANLPLLIEDEPALSVPSIALRIKRAIRKFGRIGLIVVDHLHIVGRPESASRFGDTQAITEISMAIKRTAKEFNVPVLLLAQLNRGLESREDKRPGMQDLRQSGAIEQDAEAIMFIYRPDYHASKRPAVSRFGEAAAEPDAYLRNMEGKGEIIFDKVRDGETGTEILCFDAKRVRFHEEGEP